MRVHLGGLGNYETDSQESYALSVIEKELLQEPVEREKQGCFEPKFNPKDEFPVWVRQEFPDLRNYAQKRKSYLLLIKRFGEVNEAVKLARKGVEITAGIGRPCHRKFLEPYFSRFSKCSWGLKMFNGKNYAIALENLTSALEVSGTNGFPYRGNIIGFRKINRDSFFRRMLKNVQR